MKNTSTSSQESADSHSQQTESLETSSTPSSSGTSSAPKSSKSTGPKLNTTRTSNSLLPTPTTLDAKSRDYYSKGDLAIGGVIKYSSLQVDSRVSPFPKLDEEKERTMTATSGLQCLNASLFSDQNGSSLKTFLDLFLGTKAWFSSKCALTWKTKTTKYNRSLFQLSPSMRHTNETGYGLLLTPRASEAEENQARFVERNGDRTMRAFPNVSTQIAMLPTPDANMGNRGEAKDLSTIRPSGHHKQRKLNDIVKHGASTGLKLQPRFVEWMMGFPDDWTEIPDSKLLEMRLSRKSQKKSCER